MDRTVKPSVLRQIAKRFITEHYPEYSSDVDGIWDMFNKMNIGKIGPGRESQSLLPGGLGFSDEADPEFQEVLSGIAVFYFTYKKIDGKRGISKADLLEHLKDVCSALKTKPDVDKKIKAAVDEGLDIDVVTLSNINKASSVALPDEGRNTKDNYVVYISNSSGFESGKSVLSKKKMKTRYLNKKEAYDIFVYHDNVWKKSRKKGGKGKDSVLLIDVEAITYNLLVMFLKHKDDRLSYLELYKNAWANSARFVSWAKDSQVIIDVLKTAVSKLRATLKGVEGFDIPHARKGGYVCRGDFKFCLVLTVSKDRHYEV